MRLLRIGESGAEQPAHLDGEGRLRDLSVLGRDFDGGFFANGGIDKVRAAMATDRPVIGELRADGTIEVVECRRIGAPVAKPEKIICIGLNYRDHAEESGQPIPTEPGILVNPRPGTTCDYAPAPDAHSSGPRRSGRSASAMASPSRLQPSTMCWPTRR